MSVNRGRRFVLQVAASSAAIGSATSWVTHAAQAAGPIRALAFDAFPVFDPRPIQVLAEALLPGQGAQLMNAWRTRLFEYQWLRALGGQYADFMQTVRDSLAFAVRQVPVQLSATQRNQLVDAWLNLQVWPDAVAGLTALREAGLRLTFLSNMTESMLRAGLRNAGIEDRFEAVISTDRIRSYKPDPRAYQLGVEALGLPREQILFVAFAGWDVAGAKWFGYPTFWLNRQAAAPEQFGVAADGEGSDLAALRDFVSRNAQPRR